MIFHTVTYIWYTQGQSNLNQKEGTQKLRKGEQSFFFLYPTHHLDLIHIAIEFHQDIPYGDLVVACTKIVWQKSLIKEK